MRAGKYDIIFDGPHFAAWRIKKGFVPVRGGMTQLAAKIEGGECVTGVMRSDVYEKKLGDGQRQSMHVLTRSKPLTHQGITVSSRIDAAARQRLAASLSSDDGRKAAAPLLARFSANGFMPPSRATTPDRICSSRMWCTVGNGDGRVGCCGTRRHRLAPVPGIGALRRCRIQPPQFQALAPFAPGFR